MNDSLQEDEQQTDKPKIDCLAGMPHSEEVEDAQQHRHCSEVG
jgi:hypothetical protein